MIGKCYKKLGRPPQEVLAWFQEASRKTPARAGQHGGPEKILEPDYQLCASLLKYLYEGKIDVSHIPNAYYYVFLLMQCS